MENFSKLFEYLENDIFGVMFSVISTKQTVVMTDYFGYSLRSKLEECGFTDWCVFPVVYGGLPMVEVLI